MPDSAHETFPLLLRQHQRDALIHATRLRAKIKNRLKGTPKGSQVVEFTQKELGQISDEIDTAAVYAPSPYKKRLVAVQRKISDLLDAVADHAEAPGRRRKPTGTADLIVQFKITLLDTKPAIWRRIQVPDGPLAMLHECIQAAFGWWNYHLHQFVIDGVQFGPSFPDDFDFGLEMEDEGQVLISDLLPKSGKRTRWWYEYDFGDDWRHEVLFEGYPPLEKGQKYPVCLDGARACPPEDVGGPWGYAEYLEAMADPKHEQHDDFMEWRGPFDPEAFDARKATKQMRKIG